jgi:hypothetical protein
MIATTTTCRLINPSSKLLSRPEVSFFRQCRKYKFCSTSATSGSRSHNNNNNNNDNNNKKQTGVSVQYFHNEQALCFILSENQRISESKIPHVYSPAIYVNNDQINFVKANSSCADDYNDDVAVEKMVTDMADIIDAHYALEGKDQFVGGMGENDGGVWFVSNDHCVETLDYWEQIRDVIVATKEKRHGIPFGVYSSGIMKDRITDLKQKIGISSIQVTLGSGDPNSYGEVVQSRNGLSSAAAFGQVCQFIAESSESGFPVTAAVAGGKHAAPGSELAKALGAIDVVVYDNIN